AEGSSAMSDAKEGPSGPSFFGSGAVSARTAIGAQMLLSQSNSSWRHFDELILIDPLQSFINRHHARRTQGDGLVLARSSHVGELLFFGGVDVDVIGAIVLANDHSLVNLSVS